MSQSDATGRSFLYAGASAGTHTITHNLNSRWVSYNLFVTATGVAIPESAITSVTATSANVLTIVLASPTAITVRLNT